MSNLLIHVKEKIPTTPRNGILTGTLGRYHQTGQEGPWSLELVDVDPSLLENGIDICEEAFWWARPSLNIPAWTRIQIQGDEVQLLGPDLENILNLLRSKFLAPDDATACGLAYSLLLADVFRRIHPQRCQAREYVDGG